MIRHVKAICCLVLFVLYTYVLELFSRQLIMAAVAAAVGIFLYRVALCVVDRMEALK